MVLVLDLEEHCRGSKRSRRNRRVDRMVGRVVVGGCSLVGQEVGLGRERRELFVLHRSFLRLLEGAAITI